MYKGADYIYRHMYVCYNSKSALQLYISKLHTLLLCLWPDPSIYIYI